MYYSHKRYVCVYGCIGHGDDKSGEDWSFAFVLLKKYNLKKKLREINGEEKEEEWNEMKFFKGKAFKVCV